MAYFRGFGRRTASEARSEWSRMRALRRQQPAFLNNNPMRRAFVPMVRPNPRYRTAAMREATAYKRFRHVSLEDDVLAMLAERVPEDVAFNIADYVGWYDGIGPYMENGEFYSK